jgi:hypothetical protein
MALDATAFGNWGCTPHHYPAVVDLVLSGEVRIEPFIEFHDLRHGRALFEHGGGASRRPILLP